MLFDARPAFVELARTSRTWQPTNNRRLRLYDDHHHKSSCALRPSWSPWPQMPMVHVDVGPTLEPADMHYEHNYVSRPASVALMHHRRWDAWSDSRMTPSCTGLARAVRAVGHGPTWHCRY